MISFANDIPVTNDLPAIKESSATMANICQAAFIIIIIIAVVAFIIMISVQIQDRLYFDEKLIPNFISSNFHKFVYKKKCAKLNSALKKQDLYKMQKCLKRYVKKSKKDYNYCRILRKQILEKSNNYSLFNDKSAFFKSFSFMKKFFELASTENITDKEKYFVETMRCGLDNLYTKKDGKMIKINLNNNNLTFTNDDYNEVYCCYYVSCGKFKPNHTIGSDKFEKYNNAFFIPTPSWLN